MQQAPNQFDTTLVVGVDFSTSGQMALQEAVRLQSKSTESVMIHVVHVVTDKGRYGSTGTLLEAEDSALTQVPKELQTYVSNAYKEADLAPSNVAVHVRIGDPVEGVHQTAVDYEADLIIVGTHGRKGLERLVLGSVAERLLRTAQCPVYVLRPNTLNSLQKSDSIEPARDDEKPTSPDSLSSHVYESGGSASWSRPSWVSGLRMK